MSTEQLLVRLMNEYGDAILRMCFLYLKDYHLAEDAAQETFIKAMKSYSSFQHKSDEKTWLTRIAINCCKSTMRTRWFKMIRTDSSDNLTEDSTNQIEEFFKKESLTNAIMKLNENERKLIILYYYQELPVKEIAIIVGKKENTVNQQLRRAREKLKRILKEDE